MTFLKSLCAALMVVLLATGCSVLESIEDSPMASELITSQLTLRFIAGADDPVARAAKLRETLADIKGGMTERYTLLELDEAVRAKINWQDYNLADQELLNFALTKARASITDLIGEGVIQSDETATIDTLFRWVDQAAQRVQ